MIVITHQHIDLNFAFKADAHFSEEIEKQSSITVIEKNISAFITSGHHMIQCTLKLKPSATVETCPAPPDVCFMEMLVLTYVMVFI